MSRAGAVAAAFLVAVLGGCDGCSPGGGGSVPVGPPGPPAAPRVYLFGFAGDPADLPWNRAVYVYRTTGGKLSERTTVTWFEDDEQVRVAGRLGTQWVAHAEDDPSPAIRSLLWDVNASGTYGTDERITIELPRRTRLRLTGDETSDPGADTLTVADEATGARLAAVRDATRGLRFGVWDQSAGPDAEDWRVSQEIAPPRPWVFADLRPGGAFAVAARSFGRCWVARRVTMDAGAEVVLDVAAQPAGGATVVCENPRAELLLNGDIPVPPIRIMKDFYRARWPGVPQGEHAVRYPDGTIVKVVVDAAAAAPRASAADATEIQLPRVPE